MSAVDHYLQSVLDQAATEAGADGSADIEAQHLLLALAGAQENAALLGLGRDGVRAALDREFEQSLAAAGVSVPAGLRPGRAAAKAGLGASARSALERAFASAPGKAGLRPAHLLAGVLSARVGTVPRALALAGIDQGELLSRVHQAGK